MSEVTQEDVNPNENSVEDDIRAMYKFSEEIIQFGVKVKARISKNYGISGTALRLYDLSHDEELKTSLDEVALHYNDAHQIVQEVFDHIEKAHKILDNIRIEIKEAPATETNDSNESSEVNNKPVVPSAVGTQAVPQVMTGSLQTSNLNTNFFVDPSFDIRDNSTVDEELL